VRGPGRRGSAWWNAGLGATAVGVMLVVVDQTALERRRRRGLSLSAAPIPGGASLGLRGRL